MKVKLPESRKARNEERHHAILLSNVGTYISNDRQQEPLPASL